MDLQQKTMSNISISNEKANNAQISRLGSLQGRAVSKIGCISLGPVHMWWEYSCCDKMAQLSLQKALSTASFQIFTRDSWKQALAGAK